MEQIRIKLETRGVELAARRSSNWQEIDAAPVVLFHGWPESSACWLPVLRHLDPNRRYLCPDLRGLGDSERTGTVDDFRKQALSEDMAALIDSLGIDHFVAVGHDWGGIVAQELALAYPDRVTKLAVMNINLINNPIGNLKGGQAASLSPLNPRWFMTFQAAPGLADAMIPGNEAIWLRTLLGNTAQGNSIPEESMDEYIRCYAIAGTAKTGAGFYRALHKDYVRWAGLSDPFTMPALIIYGDKDPLLLPEFFENYEACFDEVCKLDVHAGHFVQDEQPEQVAAALETFLRE